MKRENAFFEEMKKVGHAWDDERRARLEQRREIEKTYGYCSEEYSNWIAPESVKLSKQQSAAPAPKRYSPRHCFC